MPLLLTGLLMYEIIKNKTNIAKSVYCSIQKCYYYGMKLYHGSKQIIENPKNKGSKIDNDYGPAFYLTKDLGHRMGILGCSTAEMKRSLGC